MSKINEKYAHFLAELLEIIINNVGYDLLENKSSIMNEILSYIEDQNYLPNFDFREIYKFIIVNYNNSVASECIKNYLETSNEEKEKTKDDFIFDFLNEEN